MEKFDIFSPVSITEALNQRLPPKRFLARTFFKPRYWATEQVMIDTIKGSRRVAPFVRPHQAGTAVQGDAITATAFMPQQINVHVRTDAYEAFRRAAAENISYANGEIRSPEKAFAETIARDQETLVDAAYRTVERMCSEALFSGKVNMYDAEGNSISDVDEGFKDSHNITLASGKGWNEKDTDPIKDLRDWRRLVAKDSGLTAHDVIFGSDAYDAFIANASVKDYLDKRNITLGGIAPQFNQDQDGALFMGVIEGLNIWVYDEWYDDLKTKTATAVVPPEKVCVISRELRADIHYGKVQDVQAGNFVGEFFSRTYDEQDGSARYVQLRSAPLAVVEQADGLVVADVVV